MPSGLGLERRLETAETLPARGQGEFEPELHLDRHVGRRRVDDGVVSARLRGEDRHLARDSTQFKASAARDVDPIAHRGEDAIAPCERVRRSIHTHLHIPCG